MKILVLSDEVWNDRINGNNVTSNWFEGFDASFANIYANPGEPDNKCCSKYFQITDIMMLKSIVSNKPAGNILVYQKGREVNSVEHEHKRLYSFLKSISGHWLRLIREILWLIGKYDVKKMKKFIDDFKPDIIFSERMASCKMLRLEKTVLSIYDAPIVAFTGDDEYSLRNFTFSPFFWINRLMVRESLRKMIKKYRIYYSLSEEQIEEYKRTFGCNMKILRKCGSFEGPYKQKEIGNPIKMIYAGKLYFGRWKVLIEIVNQLKIINSKEQKIILEIYTKDNINEKQDKLLNDKFNSFIKGGVTQEELKKIYKEADIALHVESRNIKNRLLTRLSFSTKIIDCLFSEAAVLAYCWKEQTGLKYLKEQDAAFCVSNPTELSCFIKEIVENKELISEYQWKAYNCAQMNHLRDNIQEMLLNDLKKITEGDNDNDNDKC